MRIISGTGRSGTSMWMQIMGAAGCTVIGEAFPMDWGDRLRAANPQGFFETTLRSGINFTTNPDPHTGAHIRPDESTDWVTKILATGVMRTERAFLDRVLVSVRPWQDFMRSIGRLNEMDRVANPSLPKRTPEQLVAGWFYEHEAILRDAAGRNYPIRLVSYEHALADPARVLPEIFEWMDIVDGIEAAIATVRPDLRTRFSSGESSLDFPARWTDTFDEFTERVASDRVMEQSWRNHMTDIRAEMEHSGISGGVGADEIWPVID